VGRLILDILHALSQGHDAAGHEVQGAVSPSLLLLVSQVARQLGRQPAARQRSGAAVSSGACWHFSTQGARPPLHTDLAPSWQSNHPASAALLIWHHPSGHPPFGPFLHLQGGPGTGKTTLLRDVASLLSDTFQ